MMRFAEPLDWMVRMHYRELVIKELLNAGYEVSVIGRGWENFPKKDDQRLNILGDRIPFKETFSYMANARINLNVMPWFKGGTHERIFNSLLLKSVCLTDPSSWLEDHFTDGEDIAFYSLNRLDRLPGQVKNLLEKEEITKKIAENGYKKVMNNYVWKNNVDTILREILDLKKKA
jgi:spore maturation protein CgeB